MLVVNWLIVFVILLVMLFFSVIVGWLLVCYSLLFGNIGVWGFFLGGVVVMVVMV